MKLRISEQLHSKRFYRAKWRTNKIRWKKKEKYEIVLLSF